MFEYTSHAIIQTFIVLSNTIQNTTVKYFLKNVVQEWENITLSSYITSSKNSKCGNEKFF